MIDQQPAVVSLTDAAALKLRELTKEETNPDIGLRVYVYSGRLLRLSLRDDARRRPTPEDKLLDVNGIKVYVDGQSVSLLQGSADRLCRHAHGCRLHGQQPERRERLWLRIQLPDRGRRRRAQGLLALTFALRDRLKPPGDRRLR